jgi:hypothetical protein
MTKIPSQLDNLQASEIVIFHIENFFKIPESFENLIVSPKLQFFTTEETFKRLIQNLKNTYGEKTVLKVVLKNESIKNKIKEVFCA